MALKIDEYWIIDHFRRTLIVIRGKGKKQQEQIVPEGKVYKPALLPGFELPLADLLAVADRWAQADD